MTKPFFSLIKEDNHSKARIGEISTKHGKIETPVFMPVGTRGSVKAMTHQQLIDLNAQIILGNTYHLFLRPGQDIVDQAGGLHKFIGWDRPLLTDSGGFQVFSLTDLNKITEEGVFFQSHIDGSKIFLGPKESMSMQRSLGSDIVMCFDECPPYPVEKQKLEDAVERTIRWAKQCREYPLQEHQALFGIVQGGDDLSMRHYCAEKLCELGFEGYAIGGLSVGEPSHIMYETLEMVDSALPAEKPRYLMGVGTPQDIIQAVKRGVDMFDCVLPTRAARRGTAYTWQGKIQIKAGRYKNDFSPFDPELQSYASKFSKAYIRHLLNVDEMTGSTLVSIQNVAFYLDFMRQLRESIQEGTFPEFCEKVSKVYPT